MATANAVPIPSAIDPTIGVALNTHRIIESRMSRKMTVSEADALDEALVTALSLLQAGTSEEQRGLLAVPMATALLRPSLSMLCGHA